MHKQIWHSTSINVFVPKQLKGLWTDIRCSMYLAIGERTYKRNKAKAYQIYREEQQEIEAQRIIGGLNKWD